MACHWASQGGEADKAEMYNCGVPGLSAASHSGLLNSM